MEMGSIFPMTWQVLAVTLYALFLCALGFQWQAIIVMLAVNYVSNNDVVFIVCFFAFVSGMLGWLRTLLVPAGRT